jgi:hypothetical protein
MSTMERDLQRSLMQEPRAKRKRTDQRERRVKVINSRTHPHSEGPLDKVVWQLRNKRKHVIYFCSYGKSILLFLTVLPSTLHP